MNLIGEHTDYNDGVVLPFALGLRTAVAAGRRPDDMLSMDSLQMPGEPVAIAVRSLTPGSLHGWSAYVGGVVWSLRCAGHGVAGLDLVVDGRVPAGSGLSSSAALECATAMALADIYNLDVESGQLARHARHAENAFVGVPCGLMDQMVSMVATRGHAVFLDIRSGTVEHVAFDPAGAGLRVLVLDTHTRHDHAQGAYAERRQACAAAATRLGLSSLREIPDEGLGLALRALADSPVLARRVRHVVTENARTRRAVALLRAGAPAAIGPLLAASHQSLRDDFEVSSPELDTAVQAACDAGALGARMTGGGFGGCAIALVAEERASAVADAVVAAFSDGAFSSPTVQTAVPGAGARREYLG